MYIEEKKTFRFSWIFFNNKRDLHRNVGKQSTHKLVNIKSGIVFVVYYFKHKV